MNTNTNTREIAAIIRRDGYYTLCTPCQGAYSDAIIACRVRGFACVEICYPYGGSPHFACREGTGKWHTRGLDHVDAAAHCPKRGASLTATVKTVVD
jgi:hypothetical protein